MINSALKFSADYFSNDEVKAGYRCFLIFNISS